MDEKDIAPELLERIRADFLALLGDAQQEADTYTAAAAYAELVGSALADAFRRNLTADILPDGRLYWNIADRVVRPLLEEDYARIADAAAAAQQALNRQARIGIAPQRAVLDADRVNGLLNKLAEAERFEDAAWALAEPVRTFSRMAVDDVLKANVDFQGRAGLRPRVVRIAESGCCKWCSALAGTYDYPHVPKDVYRRHERCRCRVEYDPGEGRRQNVWNKTWTEEPEVLQSRKELAETPLPNKVHIPGDIPMQSVLPEYLRTASPGVGSITYDTGYDMVRHADEVKTAQWLHDHLGGNIVLLNEVNNYKAMTPDYIWNGKISVPEIGMILLAVLGVGAVGYGIYKLVTKNKEKDTVSSAMSYKDLQDAYWYGNERAFAGYDYRTDPYTFNPNNSAVLGYQAKMQEQMARLTDVVQQYLPDVANKQIVLDDGTLVGKMAPGMNAELGQMQILSERGN